MDELNPNNLVTRTMHDHWHKIVVVLMNRYSLTEFEVTPDDLAKLDAQRLTGGQNVVADARGGKFVIRLVSDAEARRLARKEGGLPT